jgi:hypothetical protein
MHRSLPILFPFAIAVTALSLDASPASALSVTVRVDGYDYSITTFEGSYSQNSSRFSTADMPWYGNASLAYALSTAVGDQLGLFLFGIYGPPFAYDTDIGSVFTYTYQANNVPNVISHFISKPIETAYAIISGPPTPVPGPLPLFGAAAAFAMCRRLRRRIKLAG